MMLLNNKADRDAEIIYLSINTLMDLIGSDDRDIQNRVSNYLQSIAWRNIPKSKNRQKNEVVFDYFINQLPTFIEKLCLLTEDDALKNSQDLLFLRRYLEKVLNCSLQTSSKDHAPSEDQNCKEKSEEVHITTKKEEPEDASEIQENEFPASQADNLSDKELDINRLEEKFDLPNLIQELRNFISKEAQYEKDVYYRQKIYNSLWLLTDYLKDCEPNVRREAIDFFTEFLMPSLSHPYRSKDYAFLDEIASALLNVDPENHIAINHLVFGLIWLHGFYEEKPLDLESRKQTMLEQLDKGGTGIAISKQVSLMKRVPITSLPRMIRCLRDWLFTPGFGTIIFYGIAQVIWHCVQNMSYLEFYEAWNDQSGTTHKKSLSSRSFNQEFVPALLKQLYPTDRTHPIAIKLQVSTEQSENTTAKRLWTRIFERACPDEEVPRVEDVGDLERAIAQLKLHLSVQNLAVIFYNSEPHPGLVSVLQQVSDRLSIAWITDQPVPFRSFQPEPVETLVNRVQSWLDEV